MVAFGLIPSLCVLNGLKNEMKFRSFPILREVSVSIVVFFEFVYSESIVGFFSQ